MIDSKHFTESLAEKVTKFIDFGSSVYIEVDQKNYALFDTENDETTVDDHHGLLRMRIFLQSSKWIEENDVNAEEEEEGTEIGDDENVEVNEEIRMFMKFWIKANDEKNVQKQRFIAMKDNMYVYNEDFMDCL